MALRHAWAWLIGLTLLITSSAPARSEQDEGGDYAQGYSEPDGNQASDAPDPRRLKQAPDPVKEALGADAPGKDDDLLRKADKANTSSASKADRTALESRFPKIEAPKASKALQDAARQQDWRQQAQNLPPAGPLVSVNKSGVKPQVLSLPEGKGSVRGMGLTFKTNLQTGSASLSLPISLPPARRGVGPSLSFDYSSGGSQGVAGLGWGFDVGFIARQADKGLPRYLDDIDHFVYNGGRELVRVSPTTGEVIPAEYGGAGARYYRAKVEGLLMRFFRMGSSPQSTYWVAQDKDGTLYYFGGDDSGLDMDALVCDATCTRIFRWNLVLVRDVHGNEVRYVYTKDQGASYLAEVLYNNHPEVTGQYQHRVEVVYESRPDVLTGYQTGFGITTADRVSEVRVFTDYGATAPRLDGQPSDSDGRLLVRAYKLTYKEDWLHSLLEEVQLLGKDNDPDTGLPPVRFEYQEVTGGTDFVPGLGYVNGEVRSLAGSPGGSIGDGRRDLLDVDGDGLADVFETDPTAPGALMKYYLNTGDALPNAPIAFGSAPSLQLSNTNVQLLDLDGDGRVELVHMPHIGSYSIYRLECAPVAAGQTGDRRQCSWSLFGSIPANPSIDLTTDAAEIRLVDLNGDHLIDVVRTTGTQMQHWLNLSAYPGGEGKFGQVDVTTGALSDQPIRTCVLHKGLPIQFSDSRVKLADMNGDGLQDIVLVDFGSLVYWPNQGYGVWGLGGACPAGTFGSDREVTMGNAPYYSSQDPTLVRFGDVNGDGLADMMQIRFNAVDVWLNAIDQLRDRAILGQTPVFSGITDRVRLADVNGSGSRDILWGDGGNYRYVDLTGGIKPRLITKVHNGLGGVTEIDYEASTAQYLQDRAEGREWKTVCPFPTQVVREVRTRDQMQLANSGWPESVYTTRYRYHDCYWDGFEHEYRGFAEVDEEKLGDTNSPTSHVTHYFYQGRPGEASPEDPTLVVENLKSTEHRTDTWAYATPDGAPDPVQGASTPRVYLSTTVTAFAVRTVLEPHALDLPPGKDPVRDARPVRFAYPAETHTFGYNTHAFVAGSQTQNLLALRLEGAGGAGATTHEANVTLPAAASITTHLKSTVDEVDDYGNTRQTTAHGCISGVPICEVDQPITQHATFAMNPDKWIHRPCESWTTAGPSGTTAYNHKLFAYDGAALAWGSSGAGSAMCQIGEKGLNTSGGFTIYHTDEPDQVVEEHVTDFSAQGLPRHTRAFKKLENWLYYETPGGYQDLATREVVRVGVTPGEALADYGETAVKYLTTRVSYDVGLGAVVEYRDENDQKSQAVYDALGRITQLWGPREPKATDCLGGGNPAFMQVAAIEYHLASYQQDSNLPTVPYSFVKATTFEDACDQENVKVAWSFVDGLGRTRLTVGEGDDPADLLQGQAPWIASGYVAYDAKGAARDAYDPAYLSSFDPDSPALPAPVQANCPDTDDRLPIDTVCFASTRYDSFGRAVSTLLPNGDQTRTEYLGPLVTRAFDGNDTGVGPHANPHFADTPTTTRKDGHGRVVQTEVVNVTLTHDNQTPGSKAYYFTGFSYDSLGNLVSLRTCKTGAAWDHGTLSDCPEADQLEKTQEFDSIGQRRTIVDPDAGTWRFKFDDAGNLIESTDGKWEAFHGGLTIDPGSKIAYFYDAANRLIQERCVDCVLKGPDTVLVTYFYDSPVASKGGRGFMALATDPVDDEPQDWVLGRISRIEDETGFVMFSYDRLGRQKAEVQHISATLDGNTITGDVEHYFGRVAYDDAGRVIQLTYPAPSSASDPAGPLIVRHEYDRRGMLRHIYGPDPLANHENHDYLENVRYNAKGQRWQIQYGDASRIFHELWYDRLGRLREKKIAQTTLPSEALSQGRTPYQLHWRRFTYDAASNIDAIEDLRDATAVDDYTGGKNLPYDLDIQHDALYRVTQVKYLRTLWERANYPEREEPIRREMRYAYSPIGNLLQRSTINGEGVENPAEEFYEKWLNNGAQAIPGGGPGSAITASDGHPHAFGSAIPEPAVREVNATYDANGNMKSLTVQNTGRLDHFEYTWDHYDRLVAVRKHENSVETATASYAYDSGGQRVVKTEQTPDDTGPKDTLYVTQGLEIRNHAYERYVFDGSARIARIGLAKPYDATAPPPPAPELSSLTRLVLLSDHLGSTATVLMDHDDTVSTPNADDRGCIVSTRSHLPYGGDEAESSAESGCGQPIQEQYLFTGKEAERSLGIMYFGARFYNPALSSWLSSDKATLFSGSGDRDPYRYSRNSPYRFVDPDGNQSGDVPVSSAIDEGVKAAGGAEPPKQSVVVPPDVSAKEFDQRLSASKEQWRQEQDARSRDAEQRARFGPGGNPYEGKIIVNAYKSETLTNLSKTVTFFIGILSLRQTGEGMARGCARAGPAGRPPGGTGPTGGGSTAVPRSGSGAGAVGGAGRTAQTVGRTGEDAVSGIIGIPRNAGPGRVTVPGTGRGGFRIPDFDPARTIATRGTVVEVKNVQGTLSITPQLRDLAGYANSRGVPLEIFTNAAAPTRGELFNLIQQGRVILTPF
jgi:RHS repeat-associated protein